LIALVDRVREELGMLKPDPDIYSFSALYSLFHSNSAGLSDKDRLRLAQWEADTAFRDYSNQEALRFDSVFYENLTRKRYALLLQNHIERFGVILIGYREWLNLNREVITKDADSVAGILKKLKVHQKRLDGIKATAEKTLSGAVTELKATLQQKIHRFFDNHSGSFMRNLENFIQQYTFAPDKYELNSGQTDFSQILYIVFQDFKMAIDSHITETINPELVRSVQALEKQIGEYFESLLVPFETMMEKAYDEFNGHFESTPLPVDRVNPSHIRRPQMDIIVKKSGLRLPALVTATHYSAGIKAEAIVRLGVYKAVGKSKTIFRKSADRGSREKLKALQDALRRMKRETQRSVVSQLKDYRENLKFRYVFQLVEIARESYTQAVLDRLQAYSSDLSAIFKRAGSSQADQEKAKVILEEMDRASRGLIEKINDMRRQIV